MGERVLRELHGKLRDEFLNGEIFYSLKEATDFDGDVARGIQHGAAPLRTGLQATGTTSNLAEATGGMEIWKTLAFPTSPHPRRLRRTNV